MSSIFILPRPQYHTKPKSLIGSHVQKQGDLHKSKIPILDSFCITAQVTRRFLKEPELMESINEQLSKVNLLK